MRSHGLRRTALLIDVTTFGGLDELSEVDPNRYKPLGYSGEVDELAEEFESVGYSVDRASGLTAADIGAKVKSTISAHGQGDVVVVHVMSHGKPGSRVESLHVVGSDGVDDLPAADVVTWTIECNRQEDGPHVLFLLDLCYAGRAVDAEEMTRRINPDKVWMIAASTSGGVASNARFTRALTNTLRAIRRPDVLHLSPSCPYIPFSSFAGRVDVELKAVMADDGGTEQQLDATKINPVATADANVPFFDNQPFLSRVDERPSAGSALPEELAYFVGAADVRIADGSEPAGSTDFTGRAAELRALDAWLNQRDSAPLRLVTGRAGSGKSALLGVLVCAAHPELGEHAPSLVERLPNALVRSGLVAAVPARHRDVAGFVTMISAQLLHTNDIRTPQTLVDALVLGRSRSVVVVDSLDEAAAPEEVVRELLVPLTKARDVNGHPVCRVLVASRGNSDVTALVKEHTDDVLDLDLVDRVVLEGDVEAYAQLLLSRGAPAYRNAPGVRAELAAGIAHALVTASPDERVWGEFLVTRLYVQHLIGQEPELDPVCARELGAKVPLSLGAVLELDLRSHADRVWVRPVLSALALAQGFGMPRHVIPALASACLDRSLGKPADVEVGTILDSVRTYVRAFTPLDGCTRYRLFHEGLVEYLSPRIGAAAVYHALVDTVPVTRDRVRIWALASPYVLRHALRHARGTAHAEDLLMDPEFLLCGRTEVHAAVSEAGGDLARAALDVMSATGDRSTLALVATRSGSPELASALASGPFRPVLVVPLPQQTVVSPVGFKQDVPLLGGADGTSLVRLYNPVAGFERAFVIRHPCKVLALAAIPLRDGELVTGDAEGVARVWPLEDGAVPRLVLAGHSGAVRAVAALHHGDDPVEILTADDDMIRLWRSDNGALLKTLTPPAPGTFRLLPLAGRRVLAQGDGSWLLDIANLSWHRVARSAGVTAPTVDGNTAVHWDREGFVSTVDFLSFEEHRWVQKSAAPVTAAVAVQHVHGTMVTGDTMGNLLLWYPATQESAVLGQVKGTVDALTSFVLNGEPVVACASNDGFVSVWDLATRLRVEQFRVVDPVQAFTHSSVWQAEPALGQPLVSAGWGFGGVVVVIPDGDKIQVHNSVDGTSSVLSTDSAITRVFVASGEDWAAVVAEGDGGRTRAWHPLTGKLLADKPLAPSQQPDVILVRDDLVRVEGTLSGQVRLRSVVDGGVEEFDAHEGAVTSFSHWRHKGSGRAVTCGADRYVRVWDLETHELLYEMELPSSAVNVEAVAGHLVVQTQDEVIVLSPREES